MTVERYRSSMTGEVLHSWAVEAQAEIDALRGDSARLEWLLLNETAEFGSDGQGHYVVFWVCADDANDGVSGSHIARGRTARECIDTALDGCIQRIR